MISYIHMAIACKIAELASNNLAVGPCPCRIPGEDGQRNTND